MSNLLSRLTDTVSKNPRTSLALTGFALLGGIGYMAYQRYRQPARSELLPVPLKPVSGHWLNDQPVLSAPFDSGTTQQRQRVNDYLQNTHMNMQHGNYGTLQQRADAYVYWKGAEQSILRQTRKDLNNFSSPVFQMSAHMVHNERRVLFDRARSSKTSSETLQQDLSKMTGDRSQGTGSHYVSLMDMIINGKKGPLTVEQSALGVEATIVGHHVMNKTPKYSTPRMEATRPLDPETNKPSHATTSRYGINLSNDEGTQLRDKLGLPVMMGTSGSASDVIRSYQWTAQYLAQHEPNHTVVDPSPGDNRQALQQLTFNWMRESAPMSGVRGLIEKNFASNKFRKFSVPDPKATQTHTFPEIAAGIDLTLDGKSTKNLQQSTERAQTFMARHL